jgi:arginine decarboxylase
MPIHRLDEEPRRRGVLADITCDSDGSIDSFIDPRDVKKVLELHSINDDQQYMLGIFLVGAYQEILGDMHNLFGDTAVVHISLDAEGRYAVEEVFGGDTVTDVLQYVDYAPQNLIKKMRSAIEAALREGRMTIGEARELIDRYIKGLNGYTYLVR